MIKLNDFIYSLETKYERNLLKEAISEIAWSSCQEEEIICELTEEAEKAIDNQDEVSLSNVDLWEVDVNIHIVNESEFVLNALKSVGYQVESSNISNSLYAINDEGKEIRISDHKRPAIVQDGVAIHEHEEGLIIKGIELNSNILISEGFSKLNPNQTIYLWK